MSVAGSVYGRPSREGFSPVHQSAQALMWLWKLRVMLLSRGHNLYKLWLMLYCFVPLGCAGCALFRHDELSYQELQERNAYEKERSHHLWQPATSIYK